MRLHNAANGTGIFTPAPNAGDDMPAGMSDHWLQQHRQWHGGGWVGGCREAEATQAKGHAQSTHQL